MEDKVLKAEIRSERAVRRISASLGFVIVLFVGILFLTAYLKFDPKVGEDVSAGKLEQFFEEYVNKAPLEIAILFFVSSLLCYLPACLADISTFAVGLSTLFVVYQKSVGSITKFPNGVLLVAICFFGASLYCAVKRNQIYNSKGLKIRINTLIPISSAFLLCGAVVCSKIVDFKREYELYNRLADKTEEDFVEKSFGIFEPIAPKIDMCVEADLVSAAIVFVFTALIVLLLHNFPRLAALSSLFALFYTLYKITVGSFDLTGMTLFFVPILAAACAISSVSAKLMLKSPEEYAEGELDEELDEDDEDEKEYLENKEALEKHGLEMEDY